VIDQPDSGPVSSNVTCPCGDCRNAAAVVPQAMARIMTVRAAKTNIVIGALLRQRLPYSLTDGDCSGGRCRNLKRFTPRSVRSTVHSEARLLSSRCDQTHPGRRTRGLHLGREREAPARRRAARNDRSGTIAQYWGASEWAGSRSPIRQKEPRQSSGAEFEEETGDRRAKRGKGRQ